MKNRILTLGLSIFLLFNITTISFASNDLDESKGKFNEVSSVLKNLDNEIASLNNEIFKIQSDIKNNENSINQTKNEIKNTEIMVTTLEKDINENENILSGRLREMYKSGTSSTVGLATFIFESNNLSDFISRINTAQTLVKLDKKLISENKGKVKKLNESIEAIQNKKKNLEILNENTKKSLEEIKEKQLTISNKRADLAKERDKLSNEIIKNEENLIAHQISIVYSNNPTAAQLNDAIVTLKSLLPRLSTPSVIQKTKNAIAEANYKLSKIGNPPPPSPSNPGDYKATYTMEATAYTGHGITAMGTVPVRDPQGLSTVAVDKTVIPLGSKVYVPGYGYAVADDTGDAIKGMKIDLYMNSEGECYSFGRRNVTVHVIAYPGEW